MQEGEINGRRRRIGVADPDTIILREALEATEENKVFTYEMGEELIKRPVKPGTRGYARLHSARKSLESLGLFFEAIDNVGYRRLSPKGTVSYQDRIFEGAKGRLKKTAEIGTHVRLEDLSREETNRTLLTTSLAGAMRMMSSASGVKRLQAAVKERNNLLPSAEVLEQFRKS